MKKNLIIVLLLCSNICFAQNKFHSKLELGYLNFWFHTIIVDAGDGWKGYYLENSGFSISSINGLTSKNNNFFYGIGVSYSKFNRYDGLSVFGEVEYKKLSKKFSPIFSARIGYNHLWNQYENGTRTAMLDLGFGYNLKLNNKKSLYLKTGALIMQQSLLIPITIGYRFN